MFRFEGFCDDKHVVRVMQAVNGMVMDFKIVPVVNAQLKNGKLVAKTSGDILELLEAYIKQHKFSSITPKQLKEFGASIGRAPGSYSNILKRAIGAKMLKPKAGTNNLNKTYLVLR